MRLLFVLIFVSLNVFADIIPMEWQKAHHSFVSLGADKVEYPFIHIKNPGKTPVLLLHGIGGNAHNWMVLGSDLSKLGYDVWAFSWLQDPSRNVDQSWQTVKEIVDYVFSQTGQKIFLAGHSLGGIVSKIYLFGVREQSNGFVVSENAKEHGQKHIRGFVSIASPNGVKTKGTNLFIPLFERLPERKPFLSKDLSEVIRNDQLAIDLLWVKSYEFTSAITRLPFYRQFMKFGFNMDYHPVGDYNIGKFSRYGVGGVPTPVTDQVAAVNGQLTTQDGSLSYVDVFFNQRTSVPLAYVAGEIDVLALGEFVSSEAKEQNSPVLVLPNAGHIDPIIGKMEKETLLFMLNFFKNN